MKYGNRTIHQSMLNTAAMVIDRSRYPQGVNIVILAQPSDEGCYLKTVPPGGVPRNRSMVVEIIIKEQTEDPLLSTVLVISAYVATCE